jgi:hypothetical protein
MDRLKTLYPTSYLYTRPGIGLINQESVSLSIKEHQPSGKVKALWKDGIIDWSSPIVPPNIRGIGLLLSPGLSQRLMPSTLMF